LETEIKWFLKIIAEDNRLGPPHISLFVAIIGEWSKNNYPNPLTILTNNLMSLSKISCRTTYYRCLKELNQYGYIKYKPSHNSFKGSFIYLLNAESNNSECKDL